MNPSIEHIRTQIAQLAREFEPATLDADAALRALHHLAAIQRMLDGVLARCTKRVDDTNAHARTADASGAALAARLVGVETTKMQTAIATATGLESLPATAAAVRAGKLSAREAELITTVAVAHPDTEAALLATVEQGLPKLKRACTDAKARREDPQARRERLHRSRCWESYVGLDGLYHGHLTVAPEIGAQIEANIARDVQRIFRSRRRSGDHESPRAYAADAVCAYFEVGTGLGRSEAVGSATREEAFDPSSASRRGRGDAQRRRSPARTNATVHILIDHGTLTAASPNADSVCEIPGVGPVDVEWVRSLLGTAFVTAVIRKGKDIATVAHLGRGISAELQTALIVDGRECCVQGCHARHYLERDHTLEFAKGGPTSFDNLEWLCSYHHRCKTNRGYRLGAKDPTTNKRMLSPPQARAG